VRFLFKTSYEQDLRLFQHGGQKFWYGLLGLLLVSAPAWAGEYVMTQLVFVAIYAIAGFGLMMLTGFTGQVSLGHAAFLAVGAYTEALLAARGVPVFVSIPAAAAFAAAAGVVVGLPALRLKGIYLAIATLAFNVIVEEIAARWESVTHGNAGMAVPAVRLFGLELQTTGGFYYLCAGLATAAALACVNLLRSPAGRAFVAIRDSEVSAQCLGVHLARYKTMSFAFSAALTGVAGALYAHKVGFISPEQFSLLVSIELITIVILGGIGFLHGAVLGSAFVIVLPQVLALAKDWLPPTMAPSGLQAVVFGIVLVLVILFEPMGLYGRWLKIRTWFELFPFYRRGMFRRQRGYTKTEQLR